METLLAPNNGAYFSRPSKIVKTGSRNPSPRNSASRRMTTHLPARTRSVIDPHRSFPSVRQPNQTQRRPISWHASLVNEYQSIQPYPAYFEPQPYQMPGSTTLAHGLPTPNSVPVMNEAFPDCPDVSLDQMNTYDFSGLQNNFYLTNTYADPTENNQFDYTTVTNVFTPENFSSTMPAWPHMQTDFSHAVHTAPVSPAFLPYSDTSDLFDSMNLENGANNDELVGMGLYDSPAEVQSASLLFGGHMPVRRKSLKLEESFEPGPLSDAGVDGEDNGDDEDIDADADADEDSDMPTSSHLHATQQAVPDPTKTQLQPSGQFQIMSSDYDTDSGLRQYVVPDFDNWGRYSTIPVSLDTYEARWC